ncbi:MAG: HDOD domain-containing protein [Chitinivibrionales bacterium]|nr:HDOD domain-containing protein [Chitinivibrionales bacterium]MBD3356971.1 HDOD domain-containing protein [Chitinivibrionales bacterium]
MSELPESVRYKAMVERIDRLPSLPEIVMRLVRVVNSPDTSADDAAELIEKDPGLTSTVLRLANSAFFGIPRTISSVTSAVVVLGFNTLRSVALSATVMEMFGEGGGAKTFRRDRFWRHSIVTAMIARNFARRNIHALMIDPESTFCAGILHDIGKLIFEEFCRDEFAAACNESRTTKRSLFCSEGAVMGVTHARIGRVLADRWALPLDLEYSIVYHHDPEAADKAREMVTLVHVADLLAHAGGVDLWDGEVAPGMWPEARSILGIDDGKWARLLEEVKQCVEKSSEFFSVVRGGE